LRRDQFKFISWFVADKKETSSPGLGEICGFTSGQV
jgi:hypothetical protein